MFQQASRLRLRYKHRNGVITTEDLWSLPLSELDTMAINLEKEVNDSSGKSFIRKTSSKNRELELKFEIVKHVIKTLLDEEEKKKLLKTKAEKRAQIIQLIGQKENERMTGKTIEQLQQELTDLENDDETEDVEVEKVETA